ncbi:hypothetical protein [Acetobacter indonesiensis]|uniref:hypothetical protein n=1 Tax=Acetobacter indonesiensis TaxID=104101 RepID=UPI0011778A6C|nr:hypothetical protein [Acetobacter indonesiensis]MCI1438277.1 hypothetical protein [Acetobacter indonesiensis]MCI1545225.1 hypothetical protein [Acetobacter indonesiensis]MCI1764531.1 hypothetical protein [Acetobacter indonesiensis]
MKRFTCHFLALPGLMLVSLLGLSACADDSHPQHIYHPRTHHGEQYPRWYKPPASSSSSYR